MFTLSAGTAPTPTSRRERLRESTLTEIRATARRLLVDQGPEAVSLRGIAREMGMSAPALYRYYDSREDLLTALVIDCYEELIGEMTRRRDELHLEGAQHGVHGRSAEDAPRHGPVDGAAVDIPESEPLRQPAGDRALARPGRPVDRHDRATRSHAITSRASSPTSA